LQRNLEGSGMGDNGSGMPFVVDHPESEGLLRKRRQKSL